MPVFGGPRGRRVEWPIEWLRFPCPACEVPAGSPCVDMRTTARAVLARPHVDRDTLPVRRFDPNDLASRLETLGEELGQILEARGLLTDTDVAALNVARGGLLEIAHDERKRQAVAASVKHRQAPPTKGRHGPTNTDDKIRDLVAHLVDDGAPWTMRELVDWFGWAQVTVERVLEVATSRGLLEKIDADHWQASAATSAGVRA